MKIQYIVQVKISNDFVDTWQDVGITKTLNAAKTINERICGITRIVRYEEPQDKVELAFEGFCLNIVWNETARSGGIRP